MPQPDVILASASPRRRELLALVFDDFRVIPSEFDESLVPPELSPAEHVVYSAEMKARDLKDRFPNPLVIAADTVVVVNNEIMGKPSDVEDAARMLRALSGRVHQVYTGVAVARGEVLHSACESTDVEFRELTDEVVARYLATGEPMDKAGAYAIQGRASVLISGIRGCYFNVVGLPLYRLSLLLEQFGMGPLE